MADHASRQQQLEPRVGEPGGAALPHALGSADRRDRDEGGGERGLRGPVRDSKEGQPQKEQEKKAVPASEKKAVPPRKKAVPAQETVLAHEKEKRLQPEEAPQDEEQDREELPGVQRPDQIDLERRV